jgi:hypothetical protein
VEIGAEKLAVCGPKPELVGRIFGINLGKNITGGGFGQGDENFNRGRLFDHETDHKKFVA